MLFALKERFPCYWSALLFYHQLKPVVMAQKILITKFNYNLPHNEVRAIMDSVAGDFAKVSGCQWKIWLIDEAKKEAGAVYLFKNEKSLEDFKASALVQSVVTHPALSNFDFRETDIVKGPSEITNAPIAVAAMA
jgi:hypothetical protein